MMTRQKINIICSALVVAGMLSCWAYADKKVYDAKCASCHGKEGKGNPNMATVFKIDKSALDLTYSQRADKKDEELLKSISNGKNKMPAFKTQIKEEELKSLVSYIRSLAPQKTEKSKEASGESAEKPAKENLVEKSTTMPGVSEAAKKEFAKSCASCHGKEGKGNPAMAKMFKVDPSALAIVDDTTLAKSDEDLAKIIAQGLNKMPAYKGKIADKEIAELVVYLRSLKQ